MFEAIEGGIQGARCGLPISARRDLGADAHSVGALAQAENCQQNNLFELSQRCSAVHLDYIVDKTCQQNNPVALNAAQHHYLADA